MNTVCLKKTQERGLREGNRGKEVLWGTKDVSKCPFGAEGKNF